MSEYIKDESVQEEGPWHLYYDNGKVWGIGSHDFTHDTCLQISGDFGFAEEKQKYANEIVRRLNAYGKAVEPSNAVFTFDTLRMLVDILEQEPNQSPEDTAIAMKDTLIRARYALMGRGDVYEKRKSRMV